jgi:hypothetical protein
MKPYPVAEELLGPVLGWRVSGTFSVDALSDARVPAAQPPPVSVTCWLR